MRSIVMVTIILSLFMYSCNKGGTTSGGGGGGNTDLTITNISPLNPYPGDVITITGTGFSTDLTKDTVLIGKAINNAFTTFAISFSINQPKTKIISASATQIKFSTDSNLQISPSQAVAIQVKVPSGKYFTPDNPLQFKDNLKFNFSSRDPYSVPCGTVFTGDSLFFSGTGFIKPTTVTIDGKSFDIKFDAGNTTYGRGFIPIGYFGEPNPIGCAEAKQLKIKVTNGDGRSLEKVDYFYEGPNTQLSITGLDATAYYRSQTNNALLKFTGYALRSDWSLRINGTDNGDGTHFAEDIAVPISGFPNQYTVLIDLLALPVPSSGNGANYTIQFKVGASGSYGFPIASFTLFK